MSGMKTAVALVESASSEVEASGPGYLYLMKRTSLVGPTSSDSNVQQVEVDSESGVDLPSSSVPLEMFVLVHVRAHRRLTNGEGHYMRIV